MRWLKTKVHKSPGWVRSRRPAPAFLAMVAILMGCLPLFSQTTTGVIAGGVYDQSGGAIVGATVTVTDVARGLSRTLTTTSAGQYVADAQLPGTYTVTAVAMGFQTAQHLNVTLEVDQTVRVDMTLQPGSQTQTVTVTSVVPQIDTTNAVLGGTVTNNLVSNLPINGRNFVKLLTVRPGSVVLFGGTNATTYCCIP